MTALLIMGAFCLIPLDISAAFQQLIWMMALSLRIV
jgi:hypothetical protein